uniref:Uncharacterized protein n=1 Tax=Anguilla anguilla TaxID=7936 RepID=A0A0E9PY71_ANGAN
MSLIFRLCCNLESALARTKDELKQKDPMCSNLEGGGH